MFMGRIEVDDRRSEFLLGIAWYVCADQTGFEASHQPFVDRLTLGQYPDAERRIEIVHAFEQPLVKLWRIEQQRMDPLVLSLLKHTLDIDFHLPDVDADQEPLSNEAAKSGLLQHRTQFANALAQRGTRLFLIRPAPQQADQPFPAFPFGIRQRKVTKDRGGLAGSQFNRPAVEPQAEAADQRPRQSRGVCAGPPGFA